MPAVAVEGGVVHLLIPSQWIAVHAINALAHVYAVLWILSWGFGSRAYPHRLTSRALTVRNGPFYPGRIPLDAVTDAIARRERIPGEAGLVLRDGAALLPARGRVDVWLELDRPVAVRRPLSEPIHVKRLAVASDDPEQLAHMLIAAVPPRADQRLALAVSWRQPSSPTRTASVIDDVIQALDAPEADFSTANTLGEVQDILTQSRVDHVIVGGGLDLQTRLQIVQHVFDTSSSTTVHMNSPSGPESYLPFARSVLRGLTDG